jgi:membrane-associated protease RseP (regulator of RpoE activity)
MPIETLQALGLLIAALAVMSATFNVATAIIATCLGIPIDEISTWIGPKFLRFQLGPTEVSFGLIPVAGSVKFSDEDTRPDLEPRRLFLNAPWLKKVLIGIGGPLSVILAAVPVLGADAFREALDAPRWTVQAVVDSAAPLNFNALIWPLVERSGWLAAGAILTVKAAALNLLPIPVMNGGAVLISTVEAMLGRPLPANVLEWLYRLGFALLISILGLVIYRLVIGAFA